MRQRTTGGDALWAAPVRSKSAQGVMVTKYDPKRGESVAALAYEYPPGFQVPEHAHGSDQLIYAIRGLLEVTALTSRTTQRSAIVFTRLRARPALCASGQNLWVVIPPHFGLWVPARTRHRIYMPGAASMRTLYFRPGLVSALPARCAVLQVGPLLRELVIEIVRLGRLRWKNPLERALREVAVAQLEKAPVLPTVITLPREPRALAAAEAVLKNPAQSQTVAALCGEIGMSVRTLERLFQREAGTDFESWRRQVRVIKAVQLLVAGCSVKETAFAVGYRQPSAFVEAFRRCLGTTPKAWISALERAGYG